MLFLFFSFFTARSPSSVGQTLPNDRKLVKFHNLGPKVSGALPPKKNLGPKTCKIRVYSKQLQTLIANVSGMDGDIQNRKTSVSTSVPPAFGEKSPANFAPLTTKFGTWILTHPNHFFRETIFRPLGGTGGSNFYTC